MKSLKLATAVLAAAALPLSLLKPQSAFAAQAEFQPTRFSVEVVGEGPDVIMIPGLSSPRDVWMPAAEQLKNRHRVHLVQVRGFGEDAGANAEGPVVAPLVEDLATYIRANKLEGATVIGHSMGGFTGLKLAVEHPGLAGRLMIVDSLPFFSVIMNPAATPDNVQPQAKQMRDMMIGNAAANPPSTRGIAPDCDEPPAPTGIGATMSVSAKGACIINHWVQGADLRVSGQAMYDIMTGDLRDRLGEITIPVTMLYPHATPFPTAEQAAELYGAQYAGLKGVTLVPIADSRHFIMLDQYEAMMEAIEQALAR